ncbi:MAG: cupin domain-containing protein [Eubacterium sp.]|nr:cupin domain-containing protein [Eubacterium sp.]
MKYIIDLKDESNWLFPTKGYNPDGSVSEDQRTIVLPEGMDRRYCFTDSVMHKSPDPGPYVKMHEHHQGYETFFVESSSMYFYINGKKTLVEAGKIIHMQPYQAHSFIFNGDVQFRGTFHDWNCVDDSVATNALEEHFPDAKKDPEFFRLLCSNIDLHMRGIADCEEVPPEQVSAVKDPKHPMAAFAIDGAVLKMITARWENGGKKEIWLAEMEPGFCAKWDDYPVTQDLFYVQSGKVKFNIYGEDYTAGSGCLVKIPKYAPRSFEVLEDTAMYDLGGITRWYALVADFAALKKYEPEQATKEAFDEMRKKYGCQVKEYGKK